MAITLKTKINNKRRGVHHRHGKDYKQVYWPYLPLLGISFLIMVVSFFPPSFNKGRTLAYSDGLTPTNLLEATNQQRSDNRIGELGLSNQLSQAAQAKAQDMVDRDYWSHKTPDGKEPWAFIDETGYKYIQAGENLAYGFKNSEATIQGWMNSPSHRENVLNSNFVEAGFGYANSANFQNNGPETIVVALYGRPAVLGVPANASSSNLVANSSGELTKVQALFGINSVWSGLLIGLVGGAAITGLFINHGLRLRKLFKKGEHYFVAHPLLDISLIFLTIAVFNFSKVIGYIH